MDGAWPVVKYLAEQLGIADASCVKRYTDRAMTAYEHSWQLRKAYGFRVFNGAAVTAKFRGFLDGPAWTHAATARTVHRDGILVDNFYVRLRLPWAPDLLADQHLAAALTWTMGDLPLAAVVVVLLVQWQRASTAEDRTTRDGPLTGAAVR